MCLVVVSACRPCLHVYSLRRGPHAPSSFFVSYFPCGDTSAVPHSVPAFRTPWVVHGQWLWRPVAYIAPQIVCFSEYISKRWSKARAVGLCSTSVLPLREPGVGGGTSHSPFKVRHQAVDALKSGCSLRSAQTRAPARGLRQLAAAFAAKPPMLSALVPGVTAAPAMRERCVRACWACALLIPTSRACPCCHRCQR